MLLLQRYVQWRELGKFSPEVTYKYEVIKRYLEGKPLTRLTGISFESLERDTNLNKPPTEEAQ